MVNDSTQLAEKLIRDTGDRLTNARIHVLAALLGAGRALTHNEIETRLNRADGINRVTVYRVLEWLTKRGIAHKIAGEDRVWRFNVAGGGHTGQHAHFVCNGCGRVLCLDEVSEPPEPQLPAGFQLQDVELTVKGLCDACGEHARRRGKRQSATA
jgi:Fur family ferric uptake transcriptional regulator